ncbi:MAG: hypothetical protein AAFR31_12365 [Cyanobacteria bacterium J06627_8]
MNVSDAAIIQAFTVALPRQELILPSEIKRAIHQVGYELAQHHSDKAAGQIREMVQQHHCLAEPFHSIHKNFQDRYRTRFGDSLTSKPSEEPFTESLEQLMETMIVPILRSDEFATSARSVVRRSLQQDNQEDQDDLLPDVVHFFIMYLQKAISASDEQIHTILHALEQQLLSVEDIAHLLKISIDQAHQIVKNLWRRGYIDSAKSSVVGRAVAAFIRSPRPTPPTNPTTHFVLTSRGHFHLHPLLIAKREGIVES